MTGSGNYDYGATATLTATAKTGYTFVNWTKGGTEVSTTPTYSFTVTEAGSYVANFSLNSYEITALATPTDGGAVDGAGVYNHGFTATLTATPNTGYGFVNWTEDGMVVSTNASYGFTVTGERTLVANFELMTYSVTVAADPSIGGTVTGAGSYLYGSMATVEVTPNLHCQFDHWTLNGTVASEELSYTFEVTEDSYLVAHLHFYDAVDENNASMLSVYPNPAKDKLNVCGVAMQTVKVFNAIGQVIIVKECDNVENEEIDLGTFASGLYMLSVRTVEGTMVNKIFVKE